MSEVGYLDIPAKDEDKILASWMAEWEATKKLVPLCTLAESKSGPWRIEKYSITPRESERLLRKDIFNRGYRKVWTPAGEYTRLVTQKPVNFNFCGEMMYDTMEEIALIRDFLQKATGDILVSGLGLGILPTAALLRKDITSITILEIEPDVIKLSGKFTDPRIKIIQTDCWKWQAPKGAHFNWVWHDPWGRAPTEKTVEALAKNYVNIADNQSFYGLTPEIEQAVRAAL